MGCATGTDVAVGNRGGGAAAGVQAAKSRANTSKANQRNVMWTFILTPCDNTQPLVAPPVFNIRLFCAVVNTHDSQAQQLTIKA